MITLLLLFAKSVTIHVRNLQILSIKMYNIVNRLPPDNVSNLLPINDNKRELRSNFSNAQYKMCI